MWQDYIFMLGNIIFGISLIPSIIGSDKPDKKTSMTTAIMLLIYSVTFITMKMYFSAFAAFFTAIAWSILFYQKRKDDA